MQYIANKVGGKRREGTSLLGNTARRSPRQVLLWVPSYAGHPAAFMDMPEAVLAGGPLTSMNSRVEG